MEHEKSEAGGGRAQRLEEVIERNSHGAARIIGVSLVGLVRLVAPLVALAVFGMVARYAYTGIEHLGMAHFRANAQVAQMGAIVTVGITVLMGVYLAAFEASHAARGIAVVFLVAWLLLTVVLVLTDNALTTGLLSVPVEITAAGTFLFAGLAGITLVPVTLIPIVAARAPKDKYVNTFQGAMGMMGVTVKFVAVAAGVLAELFFGLHYGVNPLYVVVASMVTGFGLLWALGRISEAQTRGDVLDIGMWSFVTVVFGAYLVVISAESVQTLAGWSLFGAGFDVFAKIAYALSLGVFTVLFLVTFIVTSAFDVYSAQAEEGIWVSKPDVPKLTAGGRARLQMAAEQPAIAGMAAPKGKARTGARNAPQVNAPEGGEG